MRRIVWFIFAALLAATASARVEYAWSEPFAAPHVASTNGLSVKPGDQHVLYFSNGVVRVHHLVTDRWFDLQSAPFKECSAVEKLDDGRLMVVDGSGGKAVYGTPARTKAYHPVNWAVIVVYLLLMAGMGVWFMRRNKSSDDYFRAGGRVPWIVVSMSIYATMFSSITFLSIPALTYLTDCRYFAISFGIVQIGRAHV